METSNVSDRKLAKFTPLISTFGVLFWVGVVIFLIILNSDTYSSIKQPISELALLQLGILMDIAFFTIGIGVVSLGVGISSTMGNSRVILFLLSCVGLCLFFSGIFHTQLGSGTTPSVHNTLGLVGFILMIIAMFFCSRRFQNFEQWQGFSNYSLYWSIAALLTFFLVPILGDDFLGLAQKIFVSVIFSWLLVVSIKLRKIL